MKRSAEPLLAVAALLVSLLLVEGACQAYARLVIFARWDRDMAKPNFFLARSPDPRLAYELAPGYAIETDGKRLHVNRHGLRADADEIPSGRRKVAILGDSVTMGAGHSQERTIDQLLASRLRAAGSDAVVLNYGVPGYATSELLEFLRVKDAIYRADHVVYLLNPNDFARRDSVYEGADNGLYRMFVRPRWMLPWFVRKAVYRVMKGGGKVSVGWYRWLFEANEGRAQDDIRGMARYCAERGARFSVVLLPAGVAYADGAYALADVYDRLLGFLRAERIPALAPIEAFASDPARFFDETDHLWDVGNERMAEIIESLLAAAR
jgi:hypothetical protein